MPIITRRRFVAHAALAAVLPALDVRAQSPYPNKAIALAIGYAPGGNSDVLSRALAVSVGRSLGQSVVVENRPGAGGIVAMTQVAKAAPDGYTIGYVSNAFFTVTPVLTPVSFHPLKDLEPVAFCGTNINVLAVHPDIPVRTIPEFITWLKANSGSVNYGSSGAATGNHISTEYMLNVLGVKATHIPFKGSGPAMLDLTAGRLQFMVDSGLMAHARAGRVRPIGIFERGKTIEDMPELRNFAEFVPNWNAPEFYNFIIVPAGTPEPVRNALTAAFHEAVKDPELVKRMRVSSYELGTMPMDELRARLATETVAMRDLLRTANIQIN